MTKRIKSCHCGICEGATSDLITRILSGKSFCDMCGIKSPVLYIKAGFLLCPGCRARTIDTANA